MGDGQAVAGVGDPSTATGFAYSSAAPGDECYVAVFYAEVIPMPVLLLLLLLLLLLMLLPPSRRLKSRRQRRLLPAQVLG